MLGLKRHTVRLADHEPDWCHYGERVCRVVRESLGDAVMVVAHVGSTAVPGLPAKPIVDIMVTLADMDLVEGIRVPLEALGYVYRGQGQGSVGNLFVKESAPDIRTEHLHVVPAASQAEADYILFRDRLRADSDLRDQYAALKRSLQARFAGDRNSYTAGKEDFIQSVIKGESS